MKRFEAIEIILQNIKNDDLVVSSTGNLSREIFLIKDSPQIFYMMGSMGLASSISLGLAFCSSNRRIFVVEGDGSILMNMGSMATIGHYLPSNLIHIVLDNEAYDSTGGQSSVSDTANLDKVARAVGYDSVFRVFNRKELADALKVLENDTIEGPTFIQVKVEKGGIYERIPRVPFKTVEISERFQGFIEKTKERR